MKVAVFGLGEAGSLFAADLAASGVAVSAYDPAPVATPAGVTRCAEPRNAVEGVDLVIALTSQVDAPGVLAKSLEAIPVRAVYADLSTSSPDIKRQLGASAAGRSIAFADVALMSPVPGNGLRTPALVSGSGAARYIALMTPLGVPVESVGEKAGDAATHKLLRSVMMKGLAGLVIESMRAADAAGLSEWLWRNLVDEITEADEALLARLVRGTAAHAGRRLHEMEACLALLESLGIDPVMTRATVENLRRIPAAGVPTVPAP